MGSTKVVGYLGSPEYDSTLGAPLRAARRVWSCYQDDDTMTIHVVIPLLFLAIAFLFSMLGMGGSQLYIPILFWFGMDFKTEAIPLELMLSGWKPKVGSLSPRSRIVLGLSAGSVLGFLTGLIGRGGGSFVVPLLYISGLDPRAAAATSALVVTGSEISGFVSHLATAARPLWGLWIACAVAVLAGSQIGSRLMSTHLDPRAVKMVFGIVLLGVATLLILKDVLGLFW